MQPYSANHHCHGYILIVVLLFMQIATLLGLYALESVWIENRMSQFGLQKTEINSQLGHLMNMLEQQLQENTPICMIQAISPEELKSMTISWWQNESCAGIFQSIQYYYVVESLGEDACAHIRQSKESTADYYRLTLLGLDNDTGNKLLLQSTFIKANKLAPLCDGVTHQVEAGQQSLRALF